MSKVYQTIKAMSPEEITRMIDDATSAAINEGCFLIQKRIGQDAGDTAGSFFSGNATDALKVQFRKYIEQELWMETPDALADVSGSQPKLPVVTLDKRIKMADYVFEQYKFGSDEMDDCNVTVAAHNNWNMDDKNDFTKIVYVNYRDDLPDADSHKLSFHVRFNAEGEVDEGYALDMESGNEIGFRGDLPQPLAPEMR